MSSCELFAGFNDFYGVKSCGVTASWRVGGAQTRIFYLSLSDFVDTVWKAYPFSAGVGFPPAYYG